jgi:Uma2 family endonuclease
MPFIDQDSEASLAMYPESDGKPMSDNTLQFRWIVTFQGGLDNLFRKDPNVFVAGDLLWYPVEGQPSICAAPDTMIVIGRPRGDRRSYRQWVEGNIAPQVVFEVLSPSNTKAEMANKRKFYETHGVEEYYLYDPDDNVLVGYLRDSAGLTPIPKIQGHISPRLGIRFEIDDDDLTVYQPNGERFLTYMELAEAAHTAQENSMLDRRRIEENNRQMQRQKERDAKQIAKVNAKAELAERQALAAERIAEAERVKAEAERAKAEAAVQQAEAAQRQAEAERAKTEAMREKLKAAGLDPDAV